MTTEDVRSVFEEMSDSLLLSTIAFFSIDYIPKTLSVLKEVATARGFSEDVIRQHRGSCFAEIGLLFNCKKCKCELEIDKGDFVAGAYTCPDCNSIDLVDYMELHLPPSFADGLADFALAGGILWAIRDHRKQVAKREGILDGTYWKALQKVAQLKSQADS